MTVWVLSLAPTWLQCERRPRCGAGARPRNACALQTRCVQRNTKRDRLVVANCLSLNNMHSGRRLATPFPVRRENSYAAAHHIHGSGRGAGLFGGHRAGGGRNDLRPGFQGLLPASAGTGQDSTATLNQRGTLLGGGMVFLRYLLWWGGAGMIAAAVAILARDIFLSVRHKQSLSMPGATPPAAAPDIHWRQVATLAALAWLPIILSYGIVVVPSGMAGVRVSQTSGTQAGTLYPGAHFITPLADSVVLFDTRDQLFTTGELESSATEAKQAGAAEPLRVQAKEGLIIGLAITVRYRLDPKHLDYIQNNLPQPVEKEIVPPVVASAWREIVPNYTVREVFATKREEIRQKAASEIAQKLAADGIVVKEVMLRDIQLPPEYAKGLEGLLLKEQQNDQMGVQTEIQEKQVRISELEAEATKAQQVKQAEGDAQVKVLQAKAESDAMQYTLPLKQKQIEESKLEAEARKEATVENADANAQATVKNAEAMAQAKVLDSKAEGERRKLLAEAEAERIRVTSVADVERMKNEGAALRQNPLLINKIVAEKLSDKLQIMMVPSDGKFFFANDVLKSMNVSNQASESDQAEAPEK